MQNIRNILIKVSVALSVAILASACIHEKEAMTDNLQSVTVQMNLGQKAVTKAAPLTSIGALEIFAYTGTDRHLAGHFYNASYSGGAIYMHLILPDTGVHKVTFHVVALDAAAVKAGKRISLNDNLSESELVAATSSDASCIYMTGSVDADLDVDNLLPAPGTIAGKHNEHMLAGKVEAELTRSVSSISIHAAKVSGNTETVVVERIEWSNQKSFGYLFEQLPSVTEAVANLTSSTPYWNIGKQISENMTELHSFLTFENPHGSAPSQWDTPSLKGLSLKVVYTGGEGVVYLPPMVRNTHYDVYCTIEAEGTINVGFSVADWKDAQMWDDGIIFDHPTYSYLLPDAGSSHYSEIPAEMSYVEGDDSGAFIGYFQMAYPANQTWVPTIFDGISSRCRVEVWDAEGLSKIENSEDWISGDKWYMIKVIPNEAETVGGKVKLAITYKPNWSDQSEFLMINGTQSDPVWPYVSDEQQFEKDPNYVVITQK